MLRVLALASVCALLARADVSLTVDLSAPTNTVDERYVCFNIDTGSVFNGADFADKKLRTLTAQLGPSIIRIGGTAVDYSYYFPDAPYLVGQINDCPACGSGASAIGNEVIDSIWAFARATGMDLLWDVNGEMTRVGTGPWLPALNFTPMATYLQSKYGGTTPGFAYSVGNEPDLWKVNKVSTEQLARDAVTMVNTLKGFNIGRETYGSSFAGVSTSDATAFLPIAAAGGVHGYTVHNYPYGNKDCNVSAYLQKAPVATALGGKLAAVRAIRDAVAPGMLLVLEEVAGSSGGGCENVTDRFVAGFAWLTTLSTVGASGFQRVHRQDIFGWSFAFGMSHYMLVGPAGWTNGSHAALTPHPDYYTTLLWRQLVGRRVLNTSLAGPEAGAAFASAWCAGSGAPYGAKGSVVLAWTNSEPAALAVALPPALAAARFTAFTLTATADGDAQFADLVSDAVYLNGQLLTTDDSGVVQGLPFAAPDQPASAVLTAPPYSYGFVVFDTAAADVPACAP